MAHNTISPVFSNFDAISFLQTEFGKSYSDFYNKFTKKQYKIFSFYHYKNFAIVSLFLIYDYEEYIKYLNYNNLPIINFSL